MSTRRLVSAALAGLAIAVALPAPAAAARFAIGVATPAAIPALQRALGPGSESLAPLPAVVVERAVAPRLRQLPGATYVERLGSRRPAFEANDPLAREQWHLAANRAFDFWPELPLLPPVRVAVIDSGIDAGHPELRDRIVEAKSFVGSSVREDTTGHGTFVAGLIAATIDNAEGVAGMAPSAELLIAKVVDEGGSIDIESEARAIRWAVDQGARVINMSLGGVRDPRDASRDTYSPLEEAAIGYATRTGAVVVAAVGNSDAAPAQPWPFASYPAALPHVLGVSALARNGSSPAFSNRDKIFNDLAAPGQSLLSTFPRALTAPFKECAEQGYSSCGPSEYREAEGTSFAAPQVSAAAAALIALRPLLRPEQVTALLTGRQSTSTPGPGAEPARSAATRSPAGGGSTSPRRSARWRQPLPPADRGSRTTTWARRQRRSGGGCSGCRRRSTTGTTRTTSTRSGSGAGSRLRQRARTCRHRHEPHRVAAGREEHRRLRLARPNGRQSARPGAREYLRYRARARGGSTTSRSSSARGAAAATS